MDASVAGSVELGPHRAHDLSTASGEPISTESVGALPERFRRFLAQYGITTGGDDELLDLLAATLSSQFVIMAGPSGSGKSLMASALAAFFAPQIGADVLSPPDYSPSRRSSSDFILT